jgi:DNA-directed RNA polymerase specialized sigma24 family protein
MTIAQDERARKIALFFLFSLADERVAFQAAHKAIAQFKGSSQQAHLDASTIRILKKIYDRHKMLLDRDTIANAEPPSSWLLESGISAEHWLRFKRNSSDQEVLALVFSRIIGFTETEIADGLGVSAGTIRYRVGKALRHLGSLIEKGA